MKRRMWGVYRGSALQKNCDGQFLLFETRRGAEAVRAWSDAVKPLEIHAFVERSPKRKQYGPRPAGDKNKERDQ